MVQLSAPGFRERHLLPEPYWRADEMSVREQRKAIRWYRGQILCLLFASVFGALTITVGRDKNLASALAVCAFAGAGVFTYLLRAEAPQAIWYQGRAAAESVKGLVWRYVVRARPFDGPAESTEADYAFLEQLGEVFLTHRGHGVIPTDAVPVITDEMRRLRALPLHARRDLYLQERLRAQALWYRSRADAYTTSTSKWSLATGMAILAGIPLAALQIFEQIPHVLGILSTIGASITAWTQLKQYRPLTSAYRLAAQELEQLEGQLTRLIPADADAELEWSRLARDAEATLAREQAVWRARSDRRI
ncbi:DUF4231 domain-containing protein [Streptacidiphilus monticola]|uniref:DUF4231 domain-containing protein n=1 Tax=Streptacidiphilus monticola TaxID=2161674 RepID=A0ABW1GDR4_9ACTN